MSSTISTASSQGASAANDAINKATALGFGSGAIIFDDLESFTNHSDACNQPVRYFINSWSNTLAANGWAAGVYGSSCGSNMTTFASIGRPPDNVWLAEWNGNPDTFAVSCVPAGYWVLTQRHHQFVGGHTETHGGVAISIDNDCAGGLFDGWRQNLLGC